MLEYYLMARQMHSQVNFQNVISLSRNSYVQSQIPTLRFLNLFTLKIVGLIMMLIIIANTLVYYFTNERYCHNIGRTHKSNAVYYLLNRDKMEVRQKCFDPDCRYYQSPPFDLNYLVDSPEGDDSILIASLENFEKENNLMA